MKFQPLTLNRFRVMHKKPFGGHKVPPPRVKLSWVIYTLRKIGFKIELRGSILNSF